MKKLLYNYFRTKGDNEVELHVSWVSEIFQKIGYIIWIILFIGIPLDKVLFTMNFLWLLFFPVSFIIGFLGFIVIAGIDALYDTLYKFLYKKFQKSY